MGRVGIVVDSTADLDPSYYSDHDVVMVPLTVRFGEEAFLDWVQLRPDEFYGKLVACEQLPKTSQPSVAQFVDAYRDISRTCDSIVSLHLSSELSGTVSSAEVAASHVNVPVSVVDTRLASLGIALVLDEVVAARERAASREELVNIAQRRSASITTLFYVETLRYLQMGGRIGKASALAGSLLRIRPILKLQDGVVAPYKKIKGADRVFAELVGAMKAAAGGRKVKVALEHAVAPGALDTLRELISAEHVAHDVIFESQVGSVIGTYIGPGAFSVSFYVETGE